MQELIKPTIDLFGPNLLAHTYVKVSWFTSFVRPNLSAITISLWLLWNWINFYGRDTQSLKINGYSLIYNVYVVL